MENFESLGLRAGVWRGILRSESQPGRIAMTHLGEIIRIAEVTPLSGGEWQVSVDLPADRISEGICTFILLEDQGKGDEPPQPGARRLASQPLIAGAPLDEDLRAEIALLRAEITLLKQEFRRLATNVPQP